MIDLESLSRRWGLPLDARGCVAIPGGYVTALPSGELAAVVCGPTPRTNGLPIAARVLFRNLVGTTVLFPPHAFGRVLEWLEGNQ